jgi:hypothetical protein
MLIRSTFTSSSSSLNTVLMAYTCAATIIIQGLQMIKRGDQNLLIE